MLIKTKPHSPWPFQALIIRWTKDKCRCVNTRADVCVICDDSKSPLLFAAMCETQTITNKNLKTVSYRWYWVWNRKKSSKISVFSPFFMMELFILISSSSTPTNHNLVHRPWWIAAALHIQRGPWLAYGDLSCMLSDDRHFLEARAACGEV